MTHKAVRVNVRPLTLEGIMRSSLNDRRLASGYLWSQLLEAAKKLWPDFEPDEHRLLVGYPLPPQRVKEKADANQPFVPRWRRWISKEDMDDEGI